MEKKNSNLQKFIKYIPVLAAGILAVCISFGIYRSIQESAMDGYQVVLLGDSIMGKERCDKRVDGVIQETTGMSVYNGAFGGTCASAGNPQNSYDYHEESLNLCRLVDAICEKDFGVQLADLPNNQFQSWYFPEALENLSKVDFNKVDVVLLEHGNNDYSGGRPLDNQNDPYDIYTFGGALRYSIRELQEHYPDLKIILVTPNFCWIDDSEPCNVQDFGQGTMDEYVDLKLQIAEEFGLDVIDVYHEIGFDETNILSYTEDGIHLNESGRGIYGTFVGEKLLECMEK